MLKRMAVVLCAAVSIAGCTEPVAVNSAEPQPGPEPASAGPNLDIEYSSGFYPLGDGRYYWDGNPPPGDLEKAVITDMGTRALVPAPTDERPLAVAKGWTRWESGQQGKARVSYRVYGPTGTQIAENFAETDWRWCSGSIGIYCTTGSAFVDDSIPPSILPFNQCGVRIVTNGRHWARKTLPFGIQAQWLVFQSPELKPWGPDDRASPQEDSPAVSCDTPARVVVTLNSSQVERGNGTQAYARAYRRDGSEITNCRWEWYAVDWRYATVDSTGYVTAGIEDGGTAIEAFCRAVSGMSWVSFMTLPPTTTCDLAAASAECPTNPPPSTGGGGTPPPDTTSTPEVVCTEPGFDPYTPCPGEWWEGEVCDQEVEHRLMEGEDGQLYWGQEITVTCYWVRQWLYPGDEPPKGTYDGGYQRVSASRSSDLGAVLRLALVSKLPSGRRAAFVRAPSPNQDLLVITPDASPSDIAALFALAATRRDNRGSDWSTFALSRSTLRSGSEKAERNAAKYLDRLAKAKPTAVDGIGVVPNIPVQLRRK